MYKILPRVRYRVVRSRNNGEFWSEIFNEDWRDEDDAMKVMEYYHEKHPSDWVKVVKIEMSEVKAILGNKKKNVKKNKDDDFNDDIEKELKRLGLSRSQKEKYPSEKAEPITVNDDMDNISIANIVYPELLNI